MRPITLQNHNLNKGPSSSKEFNALRQSMQTDLSTLFAIANQNEAEIAQSMDHVLRENYFLQNRIELLQGQMKELAHDKRLNETDGESSLFRTFYHANNISSNEKRPVDVDTLHGTVSPMVVTSHNKVSYLNDIGEHILPSSLEIEAIESTDTSEINAETGDRDYYQIDTTGIYQALDGDKNTFWIREAEFSTDKCVTEVYGILNIKIPQEISNNVYTNTLTLHPSPEYAMSILDIQYKNQNGEWRRIETYPTIQSGNSEIPEEIKESGKIVLSFPKRQIEEIQIKVKQPYWFTDDNKRIFMYGFQDIIVEYREYSQDAAEFVTAFSLEGTDRRFSNVANPKVKSPVGTSEPNQYTVSHELYFDAGLTEQFEFATEIFQDLQKVYVKTILKTTSNTVPILTEIELPYRYETIIDI